MKRAFLGFIAGFIATLTFHQFVLFVLWYAKVTPNFPWPMRPVPPFGVPAVISLAFWGGVWGIIMIPALSRIRGEGAYWIAAILFGAILPTLVAGLVVAPLKHQPVPHGGAMIATGLAVNAAWGLGTALFFRFLARQR